MKTVIKALLPAHAGRNGFYPTHYPPIDSWPRAGRSAASVPALWERASTAFRTGMYAHVPFCASRCDFCFIPVEPYRGKEHAERFLRAMRTETALLAPSFSGRRFDSLYVGGGTPTILDKRALGEFFSALRGAFSFEKGMPFSVETSPQFLDRGKLLLLARQGVSWISMGLQSLDQEVVSRAGRAQSNSRLPEVFRAARDCGIPHINIDLLIGLGGQSAEGFLEDVKRTASWRPDQVHLNVYKPVRGVKDPLRKRMRTLLQEKAMSLLLREGYTRLDGDSAVLTREGQNKCASVDFCLTHHLLGLGPVSLSHIWGAARYENFPSFDSYAAALERGRLPISRLVTLDAVSEMRHYVIANAERNARIPSAAFKERFGKPLESEFGRELSELESRGLLESTENGYSLKEAPEAVPLFYSRFCEASVLRRLAATGENRARSK